MPFPFNFYYPGKFERQAHNMFVTLYPLEDNITAIENKVMIEYWFFENILISIYFFYLFYNNINIFNIVRSIKLINLKTMYL